jgi:hypothetical protein
MPLPKYAWSFDGITTDYVSGLTPVSSGVYPPPPYSQGKYGQAVYFNNPVTGINQTAPTNALVYNTQLSLQSGVTASMWFNMQGGGTNYISILGFKFNGGTQSIQLWGFNPYSGIINTFVVYGQCTQITGSANSLFQDRWNHVALVFSPSLTYTVYINGVSVGSATFNAGLDLANIVLGTKADYGGTIGNSYYNFNGLNDDLRVYNTALTSTQVRAVYNQQGMPGRASLISSASGVAQFSTR